ncbi:MAG: hypothetical protein HKN85_02555 [Gammaproteobacteria bacterium]|nr:hypothetical protein [Gammaproteobacteria bacterium]
MKNKKFDHINSDSDGVSAAASRLEYQEPVLVCYGDVRDVTLGPTVGTNESGCEFDRRPGSPPSCPP